MKSSVFAFRDFIFLSPINGPEKLNAVVVKFGIHDVKYAEAGLDTLAGTEL